MVRRFVKFCRIDNTVVTAEARRVAAMVVSRIWEGGDWTAHWHSKRRKST